MELFLHSDTGENPDLVEIKATAKVSELLEGADSSKIWIEDAENELDLNLSLEDAGIRHRQHLHRGRCHRVEVTVRFNAEHTRDFGPNAKIKTVYDWASGKKAFNLSPEQAVKHVLTIAGADHFLDEGIHVGSLVQPASCKVTLDLCPRERFEG